MRKPSHLGFSMSLAFSRLLNLIFEARRSRGLLNFTVKGNLLLRTSIKRCEKGCMIHVEQRFLFQVVFIYIDSS